MRRLTTKNLQNPLQDFMDQAKKAGLTDEQAEDLASQSYYKALAKYESRGINNALISKVVKNDIAQFFRERKKNQINTVDPQILEEFPSSERTESLLEQKEAAETENYLRFNHPWFPRNPYAFFPAALFLDYQDRAPNGFWTNEPPRVFKDWCSRFIQVNSNTGDVFVINELIKRLKPQGRKILEAMDRCDLIPKLPKDAYYRPQWKGRLDIWNKEYRINQKYRPSKRLTLKTAESDGSLFQQYLLRVLREMTSIRPQKKDLPRMARFVTALSYANPLMLQYTKYFIDGRPIFNFDQIEGMKLILMDSMFGMASSLSMKPKDYRGQYRQTPPKSAFDELINAHWRMLVLISSQLPNQ